MTNLHRRTAQDVVKLAEEIRLQLADRLLLRPALRQLLERFKFRDQGGDTWTLGPASRTWYRFGQGSWSRSTAAPDDALDGPADLSLVGKEVLTPLAEQPVSAETPAPNDDPAAYVQGAVQRITQAYAAGAMHSDAAEALLEGIYAVDASGTVWALGVQSRKWYTFTGASWQLSARALDRAAFEGAQAGSAPQSCGNCGQPLPAGTKFCPNCGTPVPSIGSGQAGEQAVEKVRRFLAWTGDRVPEPLVRAWMPPKDFPEALIDCPHCHAINVGEVQTCVSCGRALKPAGQPAAQSPAPASSTAHQSSVPEQQRPAPAVRSGSVPATTTAAPGGAAPAPARSRRVWWFVGGGFCLLVVCALIAAVAGIGLLDPFGAQPLVSGPAQSETEPDLLVAPVIVPAGPLDASDVRLQDDFEDPARTAVPLFGQDAMEFDLNGGTALMTAHSPGALLAMYDSPSVADFVATLELSIPEPVPGAGYGMVFRSDDAVDGLVHYYLLLASPANGTLKLGRWGPGGFTDVAEAPLPANSGNHLEISVRAEGSFIEVDIEGQPTLSAEDSALLQPGILGLAMLSPRDGDQVVFWDFSVEPLER